jgi:hypothetical protein
MFTFVDNWRIEAGLRIPRRQRRKIAQRADSGVTMTFFITFSPHVSLFDRLSDLHKRALTGESALNDR